MLFNWIVGIVLAFTYEAALELSIHLIAIFSGFVYVLAEPAMLTHWGTTPGKALLKVRLRNSNGSKLAYADGLSRAFKVWMKGMGFFIPFVTFFANGYSYNRLTKHGITPWDKDGDFTVSHQVIGTPRIITVLLVLIPFMILGYAA